ncbi:MAG: GNAT family N-acetyltransferase [Ktedonobacterales bacterium]
MGFHQLDPNTFQLARHLFDTESHLAIAAALSGETPAEVYVDIPLAPRAALLIVLDHRIFLAGTPYDAAFAQGFAALMHQRYAAMATHGKPVERTIAYTPHSWEAVLPTLFVDVESQRMDRLSYRLRLDTPVVPPIPPDGFTLRQIDAALVAESALANHQALLAEMQSEAPSVEDFLRSKFGYCLQHGHELIAWCLSEYNHGDRCELGIETLPSFHRRGLALVTAGATLAHAQAHGITTIGWHCWAHNVASSNLAQRLGFGLVEEYPVWYCRFA